MERRKTTAWVVALFVLALIARLGAGWLMKVNEPEAGSDEEWYYAIITSLARGEGFSAIGQQSPDGVPRPTARYMPVPLFLMSLGVRLFGGGPLTCRLVAMTFGSLSAPLLFLFARHVTRFVPALLAAVACALYPTWVFHSVGILTEPFFVPAVLLALLLTVRELDAPAPRNPMAAGLSWGLAILTRVHALPMLALITPYVIYRKKYRLALGLVAGMAAFLTPWFVRNLTVLGHPIVLSTEGGETFLGSNNPYVVADGRHYGMWVAPTGIPEYRDRLRPIEDEYRRDRAQYAIGMRYLAERPEVIPHLVLSKWARWLTPVTQTGGMIRVTVLATYGLILVLLAVGAARGLYRGSAGLHLVLLCTAAQVIVTAVYWGNLLRGRLPLEVLWMTWAVMAVFPARVVAPGEADSPMLTQPERAL